MKLYDKDGNVVGELYDVKEDKPIYDFSTKEGVIEAITKECNRAGLIMKEQKAYIVATVDWETAHTFKPVKEAYWLDEAWRQRNLRYYPYYGRGYVQLTWEENYRKYSKKTGEDLVKFPDKALDPEVALFILIDGFKTGAFTGKKITDYINDKGVDYMGARRCINGTDKAKEIATLAKEYENYVA